MMWVPVEQWLDNHLEVVEKCSICLEPFDSIHCPARITGVKSAKQCGHIFGGKCIREWMSSGWHNDNAGKCPLCRVTYFRHEREFQDDATDEFWTEEAEEDNEDDEEVPDIAGGNADSGSDFDHEPLVDIASFPPILALRFVESLYNEACELGYAVLDAENDEDNKALIGCVKRACEEMGMRGHIEMEDETIYRLREVVLRMLREHEGAMFSIQQWGWWMVEMKEAVSRQHEDEVEEDENENNQS